MIKEIVVARTLVALVDEEDYDRLIKLTWCEHKGSKTSYARVSAKEGEFAPLMHRVILGISDPSVEVDHIDGNGLHNFKKNLRACTKSQNRMNSGKQSNNRSGYKGVRLHSPGKWEANIYVMRKQHYLGLFDDPEKAYEAYCKAAKDLHGAYAKL